jgi:hypothetical protein
MKTIFLLLVIYQFKHFLADFPLQGKYMLGKFKPGWAWVLPLLAHVGVHGVFTLVIASAFGCSYALRLALLDMAIHFIMDRIKASPDLLGRFQAISKSEYQMHMRDVEHLKEMIDKPWWDGDEQYCERLEKCEKSFAVKMRSNVFFWWALGLDQMVHHLTHYLLIYLMVR